MTFNCPHCQTDSLVITHTLELPPDSLSDEITLQLLACRECRFVAVAVYEESRRGASESWHHDGYQISHNDYAELKQLMEKCLSPKDWRCSCYTHQVLNRVENGRWQRPLPLQIPSFPMRLKRYSS